eukprot:3942880-Prorocentrum_lima.AAC.1
MPNMGVPMPNEPAAEPAGKLLNPLVHGDMRLFRSMTLLPFLVPRLIEHQSPLLVVSFFINLCTNRAKP